MSAFSHGFNHGFNFGMFNNMFGGAWSTPFINSFGVGFNSFFHCPHNFMGWNSAPLFLVPRFNFNNFVQYQTPGVQMPSIWNISVPNFSAAPNWNNVNYSMPSYTKPFISDTFVSTTNKTEDVTNDPKTNKTYVSTTKDFDKMLEFVLKAEGGYNPDDCGQPGNRGILQSTYDSYRKQNGHSTRPVKNITDEEVKDLYYKMFYKESGADKISDPKLALYVFDTAVNMGVGAAKKLLKKSGNDTEKFKTLRLQRYQSIAIEKPSKAKYLKGWQNRVSEVEKFANNEMLV